MLNGTSRFVGHRLSPKERLDWRFVLVLIGVVLVLLSYSLPMFTRRITQATTRFSGGTTVVAYYPVLIFRQHFTQARHPLKEVLLDVQIVVNAISEHSGSGWGWLAQVIGHGGGILRFLSYLICLFLPITGALVSLLLVLLTWFSDKGLAEALIPTSISLTALALPGLVLGWMHQFDFSVPLFSMERDALMPGIGFWSALGGVFLTLVAVLGLRRETRRVVVNWWALVLAVILGLWLLVRFKPYPFLEIWDFVYDGILITLRIVSTSFGFILIVSLLGGLGRISRSWIIYGISSLYVEIVRGIPLLVQLLFIWFALPQLFDVAGKALLPISGFAKAGQWLIDLRLGPFAAAVFGLTFCYGAYGSEIFRAGISSIHHGQMEAARSLGMTYIQAMRYVILPQAIRVILPPVGNEFVALLKDSSLVSVLAVSDLTRRGREYMARTFLSFDTWIMVALCYLVLTLFSSRAVEFIEAKSQFEH